jgi:hypothetical protein
MVLGLRSFLVGVCRCCSGDSHGFSDSGRQHKMVCVLGE